MASNTTFTKVIAYVSDFSQATRGLKQYELLNGRIAASLGTQFGKVGKTLGDATTSLTKSNLGDYTSKISQDLKLLDGRAGTFTETTRFMKDGTEKVTGSFKEFDQSSKSLQSNIGRLLSRAALTIPIWLALRGAVTGTISAFKNSLGGIIEYDKALQKLKKSLQGTSDEITKNFNRAKDAITRFAVESGKSTEEITKAIQRFATVGFDFETAMSAGFDATRLSILLFGEAEETANAFARALRVLVTDVNNAKKTQDEIAGALALTSELYETNAFELSELNGGLEKFAGTAKSMGFTLQETITLLAALSTRGLSADRAGRLLRTSTQKLEQNLSKTARVLGIQVNPEIDRTFDVFVKVTNAIAKLKSEAGTISPAVSEAIGELFGGVRGGEPVRDIIADIDGVSKAFAKFLDARPDIANFRDEVDDMNQQLFRQVEIYHNLNKEAGKALLTGITGGENFNESMKRVNAILGVVQKRTRAWGTNLTAAFQFASIIGIPNAIRTLSTYADSVKGDFERRFEELGAIAATGLEKGLSQTKLEEAISGLAQLRTDLSQNDVFKPSPETLKALDEIENAFVNIAASSETTKEDNKELAKTLKNISSGAIKIENSFANQAKLSEIVLKDILERMKAEGVLQSEQTKTEMKLRELFKIQGEWNDQLERQLEYERQINEEKRLQSRLSSDTIKLFRIAQENGIDVARQIGDALAGNISFDEFIRRGGEAVATFKKEFSDIFEQQQALAFFQGNRVPGLAGLRGGLRVPIEENLNPTNLTAIQLQKNRLANTLGLGGAVGGTNNTFTQNNIINQTFNVSKITSQEDFNEMAKKSFDDPVVKKKLAQVQVGNKQTNVI